MISITFIAMMAHDINKAYCEAIGDNSQVPWADAEDWQRKSAIEGVKFHLANPEAGPESSHLSWMKEKEADGWKYGPIKDATKKEHPCFTDYENLAVEQKAKDYLFKQVVASLAVIYD